MDLEFRPAAIHEFEEVKKIYSDAITHMQNLGIDQWDDVYPNDNIIRRDIESKQLYVFLNDSIPISAIALNDLHMPEYSEVQWTYQDTKFLVVHRLCVSPSKQGQGFAKKTMQCAETIAKEKGYESIRLDAYSKNPAALGLYKKLGYIHAGEVESRKGMFYCFEKLIIQKL